MRKGALSAGNRAVKTGAGAKTLRSNPPLCGVSLFRAGFPVRALRRKRGKAYLCSADGPGDGRASSHSVAPVKRETGERPVQSRCCVSHFSRFSAATAPPVRTGKSARAARRGGKANRAAISQKTCRHGCAAKSGGARARKAPREGRRPRSGKTASAWEPRLTTFPRPAGRAKGSAAPCVGRGTSFRKKRDFCRNNS